MLYIRCNKRLDELRVDQSISSRNKLLGNKNILTLNKLSWFRLNLNRCGFKRNIEELIPVMLFFIYCIQFREFLKVFKYRNKEHYETLKKVVKEMEELNKIPLDNQAVNIGPNT